MPDEALFAKQLLLIWNGADGLEKRKTKGSFTYYVLHFPLFFEHPPTYGYVLTIILLNIYLNKVCNSHTLLTAHPPQWHNVNPLIFVIW